MNTPTESQLRSAFELARDRYADLGVDAAGAIARLLKIPISVHCWQGDDVRGFENAAGELGGGLAVTGSYPGAARTADELRTDYDKAFSLIPGRHRVNLHAIYAETGPVRVSRDTLAPEHFARWTDWARDRRLGIDFNPTCFAHPMASAGFTLASADAGVRKFWVDHCRASRRIAAAFGAALGSASVCNVWIPDGYKDTPADRLAPRRRLRASLDEVFADRLDPLHLRDSVEGKLFGIGTESYTVGSHEFYLGYAASRPAGAPVMVCLDAGHFHPTETIADKLSAVLCFQDEALLHVSRGVRWDSDHVVILNDDLRATAEELARHDLLSRVRIGLDYFDASIHRVAAWVTGVRAMQKALLLALLEPTERLRAAESAGDFTARLALSEELKTLPFGAVWDWACHQSEVPVGPAWLEDIRRYERDVTARRG